MNRYLVAFLIAAVVVGADQASKAWILSMFNVPGGPSYLTLLPVLDFVLTWNHGVSFGLFQGQAVLVWVGLAAAISIAMLVWLRRASDWPTVAAIGLILGGALGNVVDRVRFGAVVDFIDAHWGSTHFWVFNVADSAISVGVAVIVLSGLFGGKRMVEPPVYEHDPDADAAGARGRE